MLKPYYYFMFWKNKQVASVHEEYSLLTEIKVWLDDKT